MSKKLSVKDRAMLAMQTPSPPVEGSAVADVGAPLKIKTGPGAFVAHLARESEVFSENQVLKSELKIWSDAVPAKKLDPAQVVPSKWANRHGDSFENAAFKALKADIESAGGNVQAIKVRPIPGSDPQRYEIVSGIAVTAPAWNWICQYSQSSNRSMSRRCLSRWTGRIVSALICVRTSRGRCTAARWMKVCMSRCANWLRQSVCRRPMSRWR